MTFLHSKVLDIRARARQLNKLLNWEEEEPLDQNCSMQKEPLRLALGGYLKRIWQQELERQKAIKPISLPLRTNGSHPGRSCTKGIESGATRDLYGLPWMLFPSGIRNINLS
jgi:hypothetical protein